MMKAAYFGIPTLRLVSLNADSRMRKPLVHLRIRGRLRPKRGAFDCEPFPWTPNISSSAVFEETLSRGGFHGRPGNSLKVWGTQTPIVFNPALTGCQDIGNSAYALGGTIVYLGLNRHQKASSACWQTGFASPDLQSRPSPLHNTQIRDSGCLHPMFGPSHMEINMASLKKVLA